MTAKSLFGTMPDGRKVNNYTLFDEKGQSVVISEYGCRIVAINVFGNDGELHDVALGYDTLGEYLNDKCYFGATIGRYANRIGGGKFTLNGVTYHLPQNDGKNTLHGGPEGFSMRLFASECGNDSVTFSLHSPDMDGGFPGNFELSEKVSFNGGSLRMEYEFTSDKDTPASITNHNYFNLNGQGCGTILGHTVSINSERYCRANDELLALSPCVNVEGTAFDFREARRIIDGMRRDDPEIINAGGGYDHCWEISGGFRPCATARGDMTGITLEVYSGMPAIQFYTGNQMGHIDGKNGAVYNSFDGFAMECQQFPNAVNEPMFPSAILRAGEVKREYIEYRFTA